MQKPLILLISPTGQVGWELLRVAQSLGQVIPAGRLHGTEEAQAFLDLSQPDSIRALIQELKPKIILNAGAYTAVDRAEQEEALALAINGTAVGILAEEAKKVGALLVHYSTDYVFDGLAQQPYMETAAVSPQSAYGRTKLAGEQALAAVGGEYLIFRTAWVYAQRGKNFLLTMQRLARERDELRVVHDQVGAPTWCRLIAEASMQVVTQLYSPRYHLDRADLSGIYHLTCAGQASWYEFACAIVRQMAYRQPLMTAITTADYPTPAKRPAYSVLANEKLQETFGIALPRWEMGLELCLQS